MSLIQRTLLPVRGWAMLRHIQRNMRLPARAHRAQPVDSRSIAAVKAEVERTRDETLFEDLQRRFKDAERERWPGIAAPLPMLSSLQ
jgi:hypothetical protein